MVWAEVNISILYEGGVILLHRVAPTVSALLLVDSVAAVMKTHLETKG